MQPYEITKPFFAIICNFLLFTVSIIPYQSLFHVFDHLILIIFHLVLALLKRSISAEQSDCEKGLCGTANLLIGVVSIF